MISIYIPTRLVEDVKQKKTEKVRGHSGGAQPPSVTQETPRSRCERQHQLITSEECVVLLPVLCTTLNPSQRESELAYSNAQENCSGNFHKICMWSLRRKNKR